MSNVILASSGMNGEKLNKLDMRCYINLENYWPEGLSVNAAYESLLIKGWKVDRRTLSAAKEGKLVKSEYLTLIHIRNWIRELTENPDLTIDDLLIIEKKKGEKNPPTS